MALAGIEEVGSGNDEYEITIAKDRDDGWDDFGKLCSNVLRDYLPVDFRVYDSSAGDEDEDFRHEIALWDNDDGGNHENEDEGGFVDS